MSSAPSPSRSPSRKSPRLLARQEAAKHAAKCIASAVRDRVWCEARTLDDPPKTYFYSLQHGTTAWTLPEGAILRAAGRDSLIPRPGDPIVRSRSISRQSSKRSSRRGSSVASVIEEAADDSGSAPARAASPTDDLASETDCEGGDATQDEPPLELHEVLQLLFSWLHDTRTLYAASRADIEELRAAHSEDLRSAQGAIAQLARRHASETKRLKEELAAARQEAATAKEAAAASASSPVRRASVAEMNMSSWAAEVDRLRDGLRKAEAQLVTEREAREQLLQEQAEAERLRDEAAAAREQAEAAMADALAEAAGPAAGPSLGVDGASEALHEELAQLREQLAIASMAASEAAEARRVAEADAAAARDEAAVAREGAETAQAAAAAAEIVAGAAGDAAALAEEASARAQADALKWQADAEGASASLIRSEWRLQGERAKAHQAGAQAVEATERAIAAGAALEHLRLKHVKTVEELDEIKGTVRVLCRLRPLKQGDEEARGPAAVVAPPPPEGGPCRSVVVQAPNASQTVGGTAKAFEFDRVFAPEASSASVFDELQPLTRKVAAGCSAAILAYGQTGSGKTYTVSALHTLVLSELWEHESANGGDAAVAVSIAEVYMDQVRDLGRSAFGAVTVEAASATPRTADVDASSSLVWTTVSSAEAARTLVAGALERRVTADNGLNAASSRSHLIIFYSLLGPRGERKGQLALVDLAGSERLARTEATGERRDEAVSINRSLTALGDVLHALVGKAEHVPYRHSKLTTLLQPCLKRGTRVALIVAASPAAPDALETIQTLGFGVRARNVHLGPMATGGAAVGTLAAGVGAGSSSGAAREIARLQKALVEAKAQTAAHERSLASFKQQASSTDEAAKASSGAVRRAEAKAKEAEHALKRSEATAHAERSRHLKEIEDLQRKLDVATTRARRPEPAAPPQAASAPPSARQPRPAPVEAKKDAARAAPADAAKAKHPLKVAPATRPAMEAKAGHNKGFAEAKGVAAAKTGAATKTGGTLPKATADLAVAANALSEPPATPPVELPRDAASVTSMAASEAAVEAASEAETMSEAEVVAEGTSEAEAAARATSEAEAAARATSEAEAAAEAFAALPTCQPAEEQASRRLSCAAAAVCMGFACTCGAFDDLSPPASACKPSDGEALPLADGEAMEAPPPFLPEESLPRDAEVFKAAALEVSTAGAAATEVIKATARESPPPSSPRGSQGGDGWPQQVLRRLSAVQDSVLPPGALSPRRASQVNVSDRPSPRASASQPGTKPALEMAPEAAAATAAAEELAVSEGMAARRDSVGSSSVISGLSATNESTLFAHRLGSAREAFSTAADASLDASSLEPSLRLSLDELDTSPLVKHLSELVAEGDATVGAPVQLPAGGSAVPSPSSVQLQQTLDERLAATDSMEAMCREMLASARAAAEDTSALDDRPLGDGVDYAEAAEAGTDGASEVDETHLAQAFAPSRTADTVAAPASAPRSAPRAAGPRPNAAASRTPGGGTTAAAVKTPGSHVYSTARTPGSAAAKTPVVPRIGLTPGAAKPQRRPLLSTPASSAGAPLTCPSRVLVRAKTAEAPMSAREPQRMLSRSARAPKPAPEMPRWR